MRYPTSEDILELSDSERLRLLEDIWDSFASEPDRLPLSDEHRAVLDERLKEYERDRAAGSVWSEVRARIK